MKCRINLNNKPLYIFKIYRLMLFKNLLPLKNNKYKFTNFQTGRALGYRKDN